MSVHKFRRPDSQRISFEYFASRFVCENGEIKRLAKGKRKTGGVNSNGYHRVRIDGKHYFTHHLVWFWHNKRWPQQIDHIDRNRANNNISNLRECTIQENLLNRNPNRKKPDPRPVRPDAGIRKRQSGRYSAEVFFLGNLKFLGMFSTYWRALRARIKFLQENHIKWQASTI